MSAPAKPLHTKRQAAVTPPAPGQVHVISRTGIYFPDAVQAIFRLRKSTLRREIREGRLRVSRRAGRYFVLGAWLLEWLEAGEVHRHGPGTCANGAQKKPAVSSRP
jgi:hypothetical protein